MGYQSICIPLSSRIDCSPRISSILLTPFSMKPAIAFSSTLNPVSEIISFIILSHKMLLSMLSQNSLTTSLGVLLHIHSKPIIFSNIIFYILINVILHLLFRQSHRMHFLYPSHNRCYDYIDTVFVFKFPGALKYISYFIFYSCKLIKINPLKRSYKL